MRRTDRKGILPTLGSQSEHTRFAKQRRGATCVEFAIVVPIVFLIFLGAMQLFRMTLVANTIEIAVMEGARVGILPDKSPDEAKSATSTILRNAGLRNFTVQATKTALSSGGFELDVSCQMPLASNGFLVPKKGKTFQVERNCRLRCER